MPFQKHLLYGNTSANTYASAYTSALAQAHKVERLIGHQSTKTKSEQETLQQPIVKSLVASNTNIRDMEKEKQNKEMIPKQCNHSTYNYRRGDPSFFTALRK